MVLYTILGLILFSMGFFLIAKIYTSGEKIIGKCPLEISKNSEIYCDGSSYLCSPAIILRRDKCDTSNIYAVNLGPTNDEFTLHINSHSSSQNKLNASCGTLLFDYYNLSIKIESRTSAQIPVAFSKRNINDRPCSFTTTMYLKDSAGSKIDDSETPLTIRVE